MQLPVNYRKNENSLHQKNTLMIDQNLILKSEIDGELCHEQYSQP